MRKRYFQTALEEEQEEDGSVSVASLCAAWDKVKNDMNTVCVRQHAISQPIFGIKPLFLRQLRLRGPVLSAGVGLF
jgi:hypothetical protein